MEAQANCIVGYSVQSSEVLLYIANFGLHIYVHLHILIDVIN